MSSAAPPASKAAPQAERSPLGEIPPPPDPTHWQRLAGSLDRLAERLLAGEVVFFVGAGFSTDSEGNSTTRLLGRLLARFEAMTSVLGDAGLKLSGTRQGEDDGWPIELVRRRGRKLRAALRSTFGLKGDDGRPLPRDQSVTKAHLGVLGQQYYAFNDWICSAYGQLLSACHAVDGRSGFLRRICEEEAVLLRELVPGTPPLQAFDLRGDFKPGEGLPASDWGKALFLETLGFNDQAVMGGDPLSPEVDDAVESLRDRLLPRHHVLARLAREGLSPILLTTNYDLLLEGAYRLAGFSTPELNEKHPPEAPLSSITYRYVTRIAEAREFFQQSQGHRSAQIVKIHGCADQYRSVRRGDRSKGRLRWRAYLPAVVFTFREIQNWREDSWSRDLVSTLLRTRSMVFCGYSGADPVLHDTFRTVYEEIERRRRSGQASDGTDARPGARRERLESSEGESLAPAFAVGSAGYREFPLLEVLRAASKAVGIKRPRLDDHLNYLPFFFKPWEPGPALDSPNLDELMLWLHHRVQRHRQLQHLERELGAALSGVLGHPVPHGEIEELRRAFADLCAAETDTANQWDQKPTSAFGHIVAWTWDFHPALLRELACSEAAVRCLLPGVRLDELHQRPWIFPAADRPAWSAWGVVLEIALRRLTAAARSTPDAWSESQPWLRIGAGRRPDLFLLPDPKRPEPLRLSLRLAGRGRQQQRRPAAGGVARRQVWWLPPGRLPWPTGAYRDTPAAEQVWDWALGRDLGRGFEALGIQPGGSSG